MKIAAAGLLSILVVAAGFFVVPRAEASMEDFGFRSFDEVIREDMRAKHAELISKVMVFSEKEAQAFWPIYRDYERDLMKLSDERLALIQDYLANYENMSEEKANELAQKSLDWRAGRIKLMRHYYKKFSKVLTPKSAAKFFQVENQLWLIMDLQIASELPLMK